MEESDYICSTEYSTARSDSPPTTPARSDSLSAEYSARCSAGHRSSGSIARCTICTILKQLRKYDPGIYCLVNKYIAGDKRFKFMCSAGHIFVAGTSNANNGCRSCNALKCAKNNAEHGKLILDTKCVNVHEDSMLRLHCERLIHERNCSNPECVALRKRGKLANRDYAVGCTRFVTCGQDFYATPRQLKYVPSVLDCFANHIQPTSSGIIAALRVFEMLFDDRFDDDTFEQQVEFTGYNRRLQVAFVHLADKHAAASYVLAIQICKENNIVLVTIPKDCTKMVKVVGEVTSQLSKVATLSVSKETGELVRTNINSLAASGRMFVGRIVDSSPGSGLSGDTSKTGRNSGESLSDNV